MFKKGLKIFFTFLFLVVFFTQPFFVRAYDFEKDSGVSQTGADAGYVESGLTSQDIPEHLAGTVVRLVLSFLGIVFFLLMMYGGFIWMTARGNEQQVEKAKNIMISAIIGLAIVVSAYGLTRMFETFVINSSSTNT